MSQRDTQNLAIRAGRRPPAGKMTFQEFHDWLDDTTWAEWVDGEVQILAPVGFGHADLVAFLLIVLRHWVEARQLGVVITAPFLMRLGPPLNRGREPDILFIATDHLDRLRNTYIDGPADLVVEITSPESVGRDRGDKFVEYEAAGILEYWLIDRDRRRAEFYQLGSDGRYRVALAGETGSYTSPVLADLELPLEWLWPDPLPPAIEALRALRLVS